MHYNLNFNMQAFSFYPIKPNFPKIRENQVKVKFTLTQSILNCMIKNDVRNCIQLRHIIMKKISKTAHNDNGKRKKNGQRPNVFFIWWLKMCFLLVINGYYLCLMGIPISSSLNEMQIFQIFPFSTKSQLVQRKKNVAILIHSIFIEWF